MAKKKKGQKAKAKKEKSGQEKKTKKPTEKELFERQIEGLRRSLESANLDLERTQAALERAREWLHSEEDRVSACASHLKRALRSECDRRLERQERLLAELDMAALVERRALGKFAVSERNGGVAKSLFLQQKMELEGKLSLLEELRLARSSQLTRLQSAEESLRERTATLQGRTREEDAERVREFLEDRAAFVRMCRDVGSERREAFRLQIRVQAVKQLEENVRLRQICEDCTERLLGEQARSRRLKQEQKSLEMEQETLLLAERDTRRRKARLEKEGRDLLRASPDLRAVVAEERRLQRTSKMVEHEEEQSTSTEDSMKINEISDESRVSSEANERLSLKAEHEEEQSGSTEDSAKINKVLDESRVSTKSDEDSAMINEFSDESRVSSEANERMSLKAEQEKEQSASSDDRSKINKVLDESRVSTKSGEDSAIIKEFSDESRVSSEANERMSLKAEREEEQSTKDKSNINHVVDESRVSTEAYEGMSQEKEQSTSIEDRSKIDQFLDESRVSTQVDEDGGMSQEKEQSTTTEDSARMNDITGESQVSSEADDWMSQKTEREQKYSSAEDNAIGSRGAAIRSRIESIREREVQHCLLEDRRREMSAILRDQAEYRTSLEEEVRRNRDSNGERMSTVLRAGRVLQARCGKLEREGMDFDVLHQIRMILDA